MNEFDRVIGLHYLKCVHVNDSKNVRGAHKDRHENIGFGNIGFDTLSKFIYDPRFENIIKILETPYVKVNEKLELPPYKEEIKMFDFDLSDSVRRMVLVGGKNGAGKTTLFTAMRLCLYGHMSFGYQNINSYYNRSVLKLL